MTLISRDPFARTELHKKKVTTNGSCDWCGSETSLYRFQTESDGGKVNCHTGRFCCKSCHDAYHS